MTSFRTWASSLTEAVRDRDSRTLLARVDWMDHMAQTVAMSQRPTMSQLQQQSSEKFRFVSHNAEGWATFATAHMGAKVAAQAGSNQVSSLLSSRPSGTNNSRSLAQQNSWHSFQLSCTVVKSSSAVARFLTSAGNLHRVGSDTNTLLVTYRMPSICTTKQSRHSVA